MVATHQYVWQKNYICVLGQSLQESFLILNWIRGIKKHIWCSLQNLIGEINPSLLLFDDWIMKKD